MAVTKIWKINGWIGDCLLYIENPNKTQNPLVIGDPKLKEEEYPLGKEADIIHKPKGILKKPSLGARLKANRCEWCGKETSALVMHQVRTLKELDESQPWAVFMKRINRKTLVVCESCHTKIHGAGCE